MKKILFLQLESNAYGGVWFVNKTLGEKFVELGYSVKMIGIRKRQSKINMGKTSIEVETINELSDWKFTQKRDVLNSLKKFKAIRTFIAYIKDIILLKKDYKSLKQKIMEYDPNFIIASHYGVLDGIPQKYLRRTVHVQHSAFRFMISDSKNIKVLRKYNHKILRLVWLSNAICNEAISSGLDNSTVIYNPIKFSTKKIANVCKNKKIVVVTRISPEKRLLDMLRIVDNVLKDHKQWVFEIYGTGDFDLESQRILQSNDRIIYKGREDDAKKVFLSSSINLNTSEYEGFPLSIIEGYACGIPVVSFNNSESIKEEIDDGYNGFIIEYKNNVAFEKKLDYLMGNLDLLDEMSKNAKEFSKKFLADTVIKEWQKLFNNVK